MTETSSTRKRGRRLAGMLAGTLALGVLPLAMPASAQTGPRDIADACPPNEVPDPGFSDVVEGANHADAIACVAWYEITQGTGGGGYEPGNPVPREQMASFIARLIDYIAENGNGPSLPEFNSDTGTNKFPCDVSPATGTTVNPHYRNIQRLAMAQLPDDGDPATDAEFIVEGGPGGLPANCYGPGLNVTRAQMASFINRAERFMGVQITTTDDFFDDDETSTHEPNINDIAAERIAVGVTSRIYRPGEDVQRDQMASFLARKLDFLAEEANTPTDITFTLPPPNATVTLESATVVEGGSIDGSVDIASNLRIDSVEVTDVVTDPASDGTCLAADVTFDNDATNPLDFTLDVEADAVADTETDNQVTCTLSFTTTFDGTTDTDTDTITITVTDTP